MKNSLFNLPVLAHFIASIKPDKKAADIILSKRAGIWVDSQKAFVVSVVKEDLDVHGKPKTRLLRIDSNVRRHLRLPGGSGTRTAFYGTQGIAADGRLDGKSRRQFHKYFQEIIQTVEDAEKILIFGPGRTKPELEKAFRRHRRFSSRVLPVETTDSMTEKQITAKVAAFFNAESSEWKG